LDQSIGIDSQQYISVKIFYQYISVKIFYIACKLWASQVRGLWAYKWA